MTPTPYKVLWVSLTVFSNGRTFFIKFIKIRYLNQNLLRLFFFWHYLSFSSGIELVVGILYSQPCILPEEITCSINS